jgi:heavy metal sensor kinase
MAFSIRTRLTFWYVLLLTVSLVAFGIVFSYTLSKIFIYRVDGQITSIANMMPHAIVKPQGQFLLPGDFDIILERFFGIRTTGNFIQVLDPHGKIVASSSNLEGTSLPLSERAYRGAVSDVTTYEVIRKVGRYPIRVVTKPIFLRQKGLVAIVQVASSLEVMEETLNSLARIYVLLVIASVVIASVIGSFLARKALKPVSELTGLARRIGAENLNERINVLTPKDEIGRLTTTINDMFERLEKSFNQIQQFTADASHELKTPLTILKGEMEIALRAKDDPAYMKEALESGLEEIDRMSHIVRNLLDLTRIDAEKEAVTNIRVHLDEVMTERVDHFRRLSHEKGVELKVAKKTSAVVCGDPVRVGQLLFNLIDNGIKYTPSGGSVEVSVDTDGDTAVVKVRDSGVGIAEEDLPYIFDRFYRVDKARTREYGSAGLGLSICKEITESLGGTIEALSSHGKGSTFIVRIPLAPSAPSAPSAPPGPPATSDTSAPQGGPDGPGGKA